MSGFAGLRLQSGDKPLGFHCLTCIILHHFIDFTVKQNMPKSTA